MPVLAPRTRTRALYTLYISLLLCSILVFVLCVVRLIYTTHFRDEPSLNGGRPFYDPSVAELVFVSGATIIWVCFLLIAVRRKVEHVFLTRVWFEYTLFGLLWLFWIGGAASSSSTWPDLSFCIQFSQCQMLMALMAFAWLGWISLTVMCAIAIYTAVGQPDPNRWQRHVHAEWAGEEGIQDEDRRSALSEMFSIAGASPSMSSFHFPSRRDHSNQTSPKASTYPGHNRSIAPSRQNSAASDRSRGNKLTDR